MSAVFFQWCLIGGGNKLLGLSTRVLDTYQIKKISHEPPMEFLCYRPQQQLRKGNIFTLVCDSVHRGGVWADSPPGRHPLGRHLPWADAPLGRHPSGQTAPLGRHPLGAGQISPLPRQPLQLTVRILLECILVPLNFEKISLLKHFM